MKNRYNVAVVGQTGVGKSSFINYLYGGNAVSSGIGKPVTTNGFHPIEMTINGLPVTIFDSWGLEVGKHEQWKVELDGELKKRGTEKPASEWFHSVFYLIQAGGARIQDCDKDIINDFIKNKYKISIVLTKCDQISEKDEVEFKSEIRKFCPGVSIISICSEEKETRAGKTKPFGKEDIERQAFSDFFDSLIIRLPLLCRSSLEKIRNAWYADAQRLAKDTGTMGLNDTDRRSDIKKITDELINNLKAKQENEVSKTLEMFQSFSKSLGYPPLSNNNSRLSEIDFRKEAQELEWYEYPLVAIFAPFGLAYILVRGNSDTQKELLSEVDSAKEKIDKHINSSIGSLELALKAIRSKALPLL